jgi:hypothetical protein
VSAVCTLLGALLFAYVLSRTGVTDILEGIGRVGGWGLAAVFMLGGLRLALRSAAWRLCMAPGTTLTFSAAFSAFLAGDTAGNITPLGLLASEPTKVFLTRHHLATRESIASLAIENLTYTVSVVGMVVAGLIVVLVTVPLSEELRWVIVAALGCLAAVSLAGWRLMRGTWDERRGARPSWRERLAAGRLAVTRFVTDHPGRLWQAFALDAAFHLLAVIEVFLTLRWVIGDRSPTLAQAVAFESLNRVIIVIFKFVPFRIGVDEALNGGLAPILSVNPAAGVSLALVRKVRSLFWAAVGLAVIAAHPTRR